MTLDLYPMSFSKARTVKAVLAKLEAAPSQSSREAVNNTVMEWHISGDHHPSTLPEYRQIFGMTDAVLHMDDGTIWVRVNDEGKWQVFQVVAAL